MEPVEDAEGQGDVAEDSPDRYGVERSLLLINISFEKKCVHDVDCQIRYNEKHQGVSPCLFLLKPN